ncbi:PREDICTED: uncharacterized protein LOC105561039 [Vollenhovia emeryi]|uniref:uncharacterized protein LOC105561039 n=1 Tax=Vollenhovia emeryi TaxID=411798 RepID=UPI0005F4568C|nr:PREDICTED: uncharacterized protein LOC105561039 [Vollenhovia emeryi]XP_011866071.1 PREDICTED: uncharacterized protein LOC105561039 [Vollenhovia emeryi]
MLNIIINTDYLKSWNGIFNLLQLVFGAICTGIIGSIEIYNSIITIGPLYQKECFFFIVSSTFFIGTFIFFISNLVSPFTASILPKTLHERLYNFFAAVLLFVASLCLILEIHTAKTAFNNYKPLLAASICGLINTILYISSGSIACVANLIK